ncbi:MAG: cadherin-like beta sandwich domain-containing protein, partial [Subdoligranulum sp.]|nr:cadherin-like beta sandwich domain-containing protein [Subdoligranulum sp.]
EVKSGQISDLIELLEERVKLDIVVTAEDGKTQRIYTLDLFNQNLVEKTNDADLGSLRVERGVMTPEFKASVTEYEVAVKEDTWSVDIIPTPDDPLAEVKVLNGTRELGDYNGNYGLALQDGENQVTVRVTSPDKTQVKDYSITIYRNQEDALKNLTPLTADDVDFENSENPIIISISEYPRIESSVFNALKEYPEKTIIFQGLDYSLTFQAANLNTVIPTREIYDFRLSFESPDADEIEALIGQRGDNAGIMEDLVMIYFDYHGDLPGPAMLNLKLGNKYGGQTLYWHYYNRERKVIEFYGTLRSNSQGSISVPINHFSTYLVTRYRSIAGAENYGNTLSQIRATIGDKQNPTTGADDADDGAPGDGT